MHCKECIGYNVKKSNENNTYPVSISVDSPRRVTSRAEVRVSPPLNCCERKTNLCESDVMYNYGTSFKIAQ